MSDPGGVPSVEAVLDLHESYTFRDHRFWCFCGTDMGTSYPDDAHRAHLAAVVSAREALVLAEGRAEAVREFLSHYATQVAYNGAGDPEQALYDYGVNGSLLRAADEGLRRANPESGDR